MEKKELLELEHQCIQECAPWCVCECPVHVDVRGICAAMRTGDLASGAKIFRKSVPFPGIISRICDQPCRNVCKRRAAGSAIAIRSLERAVLTWAPDPGRKPAVLPRKNKRAAVIGAGLSGLTVAFDLARKGWQPVVFEAADKLGGSVWDYPEQELPRGIIEGDFEVVHQLGVEFRFQSRAGIDCSVEELIEDFDAVYLGTGNRSSMPFEPGLSPDGPVTVDPLTFETGRAGVFAGGGLIRGGQTPSPIRSISDGRRAAISIDRFLQKVSLTASRETEGRYDTRLYTNIEGIEPRPMVVPADPSMGYSEEEAFEEAGRCLQCECMECVKVCEFLASFKAYPKSYLRQVYNNLSIVAGHRQGNKFINSCSICGLCQEVCPEDLHMGMVIKTARQTMVKQGKMPPSAHEFALLDMEYANSERCALTRHQPGTEACAFLFFPGCQLTASSPKNTARTYSLLTERLSGGVGLMLRCCGAPADWAGRQEAFTGVLSGFEAQWQAMGKPKVITACSTCHSVFKANLPEVPIRSLWEVLAGLDLPGKTGTAVPVVVHDPCTSRHEAAMQSSVRTILANMGCEIRELPLSRERTECCGYGGLMSVANKELADKVVKRRISESPDHYLAYCAICRFQFRAQGKPTWHLLDVIFGDGDLETAEQKGADYSQRRRNREHLKASLLKDLWNEDVTLREGDESVKLSVPDDVRDVMQERLILIEDLQKVIARAEETGFKLVSRRSGSFLAHHTLANVTYWVEYSPSQEGFTVHNAYSHRMKIREELKQ
ncbi:MAG: heterodisulfide reductase-related iron-sulfur binding cluster [Pseudomonadota bacterium]